MSDLIFGPLGESVLSLIQGISNVFLDLYFGVLTTLGNTLPILIILVLLYYSLDEDLLTRLIYLLVFSAHLNLVAKIFFHNPRPFVYNGEKYQVTTNVLNRETIWGADGFSFPSGHSQTQGVIWGYIFKKISYIPLLIIGLILLISIPLSRSYLGVHWPSDIIVGVLIGLILALLYIKIEPRLVSSIEKWTDTRKILYGILFSTFLLLIGLVGFLLGTVFPFNEPISISDPAVWAETNLGTYPGLFAGIVVGQVLEKKHLGFKKDNIGKEFVVLRMVIGFTSVVVLYLITKGISNLAVNYQAEFVWITLLIDYLSYFTIAIFIAFLIPCLFVRTENKLVKVFPNRYK